MWGRREMVSHGKERGSGKWAAREDTTRAKAGGRGGLGGESQGIEPF